MAWSLAVVLATALALAQGETLNFLVVGDWGGQDTTPYSRPGEIAAAEGMAAVSGSLGAKFVLGLGDNFYYDGTLFPHGSSFIHINDSTPLSFFFFS